MSLSLLKDAENQRDRNVPHPSTGDRRGFLTPQKGLVLVGLSLIISLFLAPPARAFHSKVIFPPQELPFRFFHNKHSKLLLDCTFCHRQIRDSTKASDNNLPKGHTLEEVGENVCALCHLFWTKRGRKPIPAECNTCHPGFHQEKETTPKPIKLPVPNINFTHKKHLDAGIECLRCHVDIDKAELATRENLPPMDKCLECHDGRTMINGKQPPEKCTTCHFSEKTGLVRIYYDTGKLKPRIHDPFWVSGGGHRAKGEANFQWCENCHAQQFCLDCHDGSRRPKFHQNDWLTLHPRAAYTNKWECTSCHRLEAFCRDCHDRLEISRKKQPSSMKQRGNPPFTTKFHPPNWVLPAPSRTPNPNHHANFCKRNINACVACHQEKECMQCHATLAQDGLGFNPHPPGFRNRGRLKKKNEKVCLKCHRRGTPF